MFKNFSKVLVSLVYLVSFNCFPDFSDKSDRVTPGQAYWVSPRYAYRVSPLKSQECYTKMVSLTKETLGRYNMVVVTKCLTEKKKKIIILMSKNVSELNNREIANELTDSRYFIR